MDYNIIFKKYLSIFLQELAIYKDKDVDDTSKIKVMMPNSHFSSAEILEWL